MGSAESREGRRASFGMDEEERVRVLQGIRLSENVVNRMKEPGQPSRVGPLAPPAAALGSSGGREKDSKPPRPDCSSGRGPPRVQVDPLERYAEEPLAPGHAFLTRCDWEQAVLQDELVRVATADRQAAAKPRSVTLRRGEGGVDQEQQRLAQRARELENQEAELRRRDAFYKEQLGRLERQNLEAYRLSSQQFHEAATKIEGTIKPRRVEPVCSGLQAQILHCYRARLQEVLLCADLVRAYQHCVSSAHKG
ncbi:MICOS complex subunit MIC25 isoform X1 [Budorcas taxicolor]|uniref:MICOS complex subunit MIC25 isoform X1 n=1 Tax=Budorcas taxicolor TaxID=37181 RepID=UPI0022838F8A|nr:MICOS complex subunit MIC25 isoform X1 [Budorcas taxicolor]